MDSFSTDNTAKIASAAGARVVQREFVNQALQFQWALDVLPIETDWVMRLDADEVLTHELAEEIRLQLMKVPADVSGVNLRRRHIFLGRWIKHGGRYPLTLLRIWRKGAARIEQRWMDEHMVLLHGRAVTFEHDFSDHNLNDLTFFTDKHNRYATREAVEVLRMRYGLSGATQCLTSESTSRQATAKRWVKERVLIACRSGSARSAIFCFVMLFSSAFSMATRGSSTISCKVTGTVSLLALRCSNSTAH